MTAPHNPGSYPPPGPPALSPPPPGPPGASSPPPGQPGFGPPPKKNWLMPVLIGVAVVVVFLRWAGPARPDRRRQSRTRPAATLPWPRRRRRRADHDLRSHLGRRTAAGQERETRRRAEGLPDRRHGAAAVTSSSPRTASSAASPRWAVTS
ncbi:hypothetical protein V2I01_23145 [Micromonospora sp. BRA006-A]|nr:hypothetical protein [Micromonospora sp. BRA006-A]